MASSRILCLTFFVLSACFGVNNLYFSFFNNIYLTNYFESLGNDELSVLSKTHGGKYKLLEYINRNTSKDSLFLVFRQSDFGFYAKRKWIRCFDPRLLKFYKTHSVEEAYRLLLEFDIDYIYIPSYAHPTIYNSKIYHIISDRSFSELIAEYGEYQLFRLKKTKNKLVEQVVFNLDKNNVNKFRNSLKLHSTANTGDNAISINIDPNVENIFSTLKADVEDKHLLYTGNGYLQYPPSYIRNGEAEFSLDPLTEYKFYSTAWGRGRLVVYLVEYSLQGESPQYRKLWDSVLNSFPQEIESSFQTLSEPSEYRLVFELYTSGELFVKKFGFIKYINNNKLFSSDLIEETRYPLEKLLERVDGNGKEIFFSELRKQNSEIAEFRKVDQLLNTQLEFLLEYQKKLSSHQKKLEFRKTITEYDTFHFRNKRIVPGVFEDNRLHFRMIIIKQSDLSRIGVKLVVDYEINGKNKHSEVYVDI